MRRVKRRARKIRRRPPSEPAPPTAVLHVPGTVYINTSNIPVPRYITKTTSAFEPLDPKLFPFSREVYKYIHYRKYPAHAAAWAGMLAISWAIAGTLCNLCDIVQPTGVLSTLGKIPRVGQLRARICCDRCAGSALCWMPPLQNGLTVPRGVTRLPGCPAVLCFKRSAEAPPLKGAHGSIPQSRHCIRSAYWSKLQYRAGV